MIKECDLGSFPALQCFGHDCWLTGNPLLQMGNESLCKVSSATSMATSIVKLYVDVLCPGTFLQTVQGSSLQQVNEGVLVALHLSSNETTSQAFGRAPHCLLQLHERMAQELPIKCFRCTSCVCNCTKYHDLWNKILALNMANLSVKQLILSITN